ncbi:hypothetical protein [Tomitella biformata]|uniref:hypothetical protein n=1 Tax=Tomitella biformata TaxID=630403 RepID=UPI0004649EF6|nr:hypothetical protein [Tomitella biformata]
MGSLEKNAAEPAAQDDGAAATEPATTAPAEVEGWRRVIVVGIAAALCAVLAGVFFVQRNSAADDAASAHSEVNTAFVDGVATAGVATAARDIITTIYTYDYNTIDGHSDRIRPLMTSGMFDEYQSMSPPNSEIIKQAKTSVSAAIDELGVGVVSITGDTAVAEVLLGIEGNNDGADIASAKMPLRVTLNKVDGQWIASEINPI